MILVYIILFICVIVFIWFALFSYLINPYKLIMIFGPKGSGKTTHKIYTARKYLRKGYKVYCDEPLPGCYLHDPNRDIGSFLYEPHSLVLCDEAGMLWDNRDFKNFKKEVRNFFKLQRHNKLIVYVYSQTLDVDLKIRNLVDEYYQLSHVLLAYVKVRRIVHTMAPASYFRKKMSLFSSDGVNAAAASSPLIDYFEYASLLTPRALSFIFIPGLNDVYDTHADTDFEWYDKKRNDKLNYIEMTDDYRERLFESKTDSFKRFVKFEYARFVPVFNDFKNKIKIVFTNTITKMKNSFDKLIHFILTHFDKK